MSEVFLSCGCKANAKRKVGEDWIASCAIHDCIDVVDIPSLSGRFARCCIESSIRPSTDNLAFFEYRGEGSRAATDTCKNCSYAKVAHDKKGTKACDNFEPRGAWDYDSYYCGHLGWD